MSEERRSGQTRLEMVSWSILGTIISALAFGGWAVRDYVSQLATQDQVFIAGTKADVALDKHMEILLAQIHNLESKPNKTQDERDQLKYLRDQLDKLREIRRRK